MNSQRSGDWWVDNVLRPVMITAMMVCLAVPPVLLLERAYRGWDGTYLLIFCFVAGLEGIWSERLMRRQRITDYTYLGSRAAQFLVLFLLLKLASYAWRGTGQLWAEARLWFSRPETILTELDLLTGGLLLVLWVGALVVARHVHEMDAVDQAGEPPPDRSSAEYYLWLTQPSGMRDREAALRWLAETIVWGGIALLGASALLYAVLPDKSVPVVATMLYVALGIALLSQGRFSVSRAAWHKEGVEVQPGLSRRWLWWAVVFLIAVTLVALVLPTQYAMGPVMAIYNLLFLVARAVVYLYALLAFAVGWLLSLLLPNRPPPEAPPLDLEQVMPLPEDARETAAMPPWITVVLTALFWIVILAIVGFALVRVLRDRLVLLEDAEGMKGGFLAGLVAMLKALWHRWRAWGREVQTTLARRLARDRPREEARARLTGFLSLRRLPPRELVRYFYLSTARRAAEAGQPRQPGQTAYEYKSALDQSFPDLEPDLAGLTEAFVQARYADRPVQEDDVEAVKPLWQRIKTALRRRRARPPENRLE